MTMMATNRVFILAEVEAIKDRNYFYLSCRRCYSKVLFDGDGNRWICRKCRTDEPKVVRRYKVNFVITDGTSLANIVVFGHNLDKFFGCSADGFELYTRQVSKLSDTFASEQILLSSVVENTFVGRSFLFGFKTCFLTAQHNKDELVPSVMSLNMLQQQHKGSTFNFDIKDDLEHKILSPGSLIAWQMLFSCHDKNFFTVSTKLNQIIKGADSSFCLNSERFGSSFFTCDLSQNDDYMMNFKDANDISHDDDMMCYSRERELSLILSCDNKENANPSENIETESEKNCLSSSHDRTQTNDILNERRDKPVSSDRHKISNSDLCMFEAEFIKNQTMFQLQTAMEKKNLVGIDNISCFSQNEKKCETKSSSCKYSSGIIISGDVTHDQFNNCHLNKTEENSLPVSAGNDSHLRNFSFTHDMKFIEAPYSEDLDAFLKDFEWHEYLACEMLHSGTETHRDCCGNSRSVSNEENEQQSDSENVAASLEKSQNSVKEEIFIEKNCRNFNGVELCQSTFDQQSVKCRDNILNRRSSSTEDLFSLSISNHSQKLMHLDFEDEKEDVKDRSKKLVLEETINVQSKTHDKLLNMLNDSSKDSVITPTFRSSFQFTHKNFSRMNDHEANDFDRRAKSNSCYVFETPLSTKHEFHLKPVPSNACTVSSHKCIRRPTSTATELKEDSDLSQCKKSFPVKLLRRSEFDHSDLPVDCSFDLFFSLSSSEVCENDTLHTEFLSSTPMTALAVVRKSQKSKKISEHIKSMEEEEKMTNGRHFSSNSNQTNLSALRNSKQCLQRRSTLTASKQHVGSNKRSFINSSFSTDNEFNCESLHDNDSEKSKTNHLRDRKRKSFSSPDLFSISLCSHTTLNEANCLLGVQECPLFRSKTLHRSSNVIDLVSRSQLRNISYGTADFDDSSDLFSSLQ